MKFVALIPTGRHTRQIRFTILFASKAYEKSTYSLTLLEISSSSVLVQSVGSGPMLQALGSSSMPGQRREMLVQSLSNHGHTDRAGTSLTIFDLASDYRW